MSAFIDDIEDRVESNRDFRRVLHTGVHLQLVAMCLRPGEETGEQLHEHTDHFLRVEDGRGELAMDGQTAILAADTAVLVPAGTRHNVRNTGHRPLKLYGLYAPPNHALGAVQHRASGAPVAATQSTLNTTG